MRKREKERERGRKREKEKERERKKERILDCKSVHAVCPRSSDPFFIVTY